MSQEIKKENILKFLTPISKALSHIIYIVVFIFIFSMLSNTIWGISLKAVMKDLITKELGTDSYISKKLDEELYKISPYSGFDRDAMIKETNNFVNKYSVQNIGRELSFLEKYISQKSLTTYKLFYKDLHKFHYELIFNKFNYDKNKALLELYNILYKYRCSLEKANQEVFKSEVAQKENRKSILGDIIFDRLDTLLVEVLLYTKSITVDEFKLYKEKEKFIDKRQLWNKLVNNYSYEFGNILRGGICEENVFIK